MAVRFSFDFEKALASIVFLASAGIRDLTKYKICKLIFLSDKHHLVRFGRPITGDRLCAMDHGAVPSAILNLLNAFIQHDHNIQDEHSDGQIVQLEEHLRLDRTFRNPHFSSDGKLDFEEFLSPSDMASLRMMVKEHGHKSFDELKALTHEMFAYKEARETPGTNAPTMTFEDLFAEDSDAIEGALEDMVENHELRKAFGGTV